MNQLLLRTRSTFFIYKKLSSMNQLLLHTRSTYLYKKVEFYVGFNILAIMFPTNVLLVLLFLLFLIVLLVRAFIVRKARVPPKKKCTCGRPSCHFHLLSVDELKEMKCTIVDDYFRNHALYVQLQSKLIALEIHDPNRPLIAKEFAAVSQEFYEIIEHKKCVDTIMSSHHIA